MQTIAISIILITIGAILAFAVTAPVEGIVLPTVGVILMAIGLGGIVVALLFFLSFSPFGGHYHTHASDPHDLTPHHTHDRHYPHDLPR